MKPLAVLAFWAASVCAAAAQTCAPEVLSVKSGATQAEFQIEVVDTPESRAQGLMFRERMGTFEGMLFVYEAPSRATFWMKNTLLPLDMLFADETGTVTRIHEGAIPGDLTPIPGGTDIQYVLEINAGVSDMLGLEEGAVLRHPSIDPQKAAWSCP